ncbi:hypothetical protein NDN08_006403 [Rhodosorus marinus]|uniref:Uncharacterized protein n=1 Tax=Rhodosorus marinus TaxID=101924 RepID=A0AAV8UNC7_9RHOD|nr:hypothetical protein NDN08_006403 [Rhodosorus marinus]
MALRNVSKIWKPSSAVVICLGFVLGLVSLCIGLGVYSSLSRCGGVKEKWKGVEKALADLRRAGRLESLDSAKVTDETYRKAWYKKYDEISSVASVLRHRSDDFQRSAAGTSNIERCAVTPEAATWEHSSMSRVGTDGVLFSIFAAIGTRTRIAVEVDSASGQGLYMSLASLTSFLSWDVYMYFQAWSGYALGNELLNNAASTSRRAQSFSTAPKVNVSEVGTATSNFNEVLKGSLVAGEIDLLCLFTEANDYKIWKSLDGVAPRVVLVTYQEYWGPDVAVIRSSSGKPRPGHDSRDTKRRRLFIGASLPALIKLANSKGYRLFYCLSNTPIAVFVLDDPTTQILKTLPAADCFRKKALDPEWMKDMAAQWDEAQTFEWIDL